MDRISQIDKDIKSLVIQGATNVALSTLEGLRAAVKTFDKNDGLPVDEYLKTVGEKLAYARPTEPLAQNAIRFIFSQKSETLEYYLQKIDEYAKLLEIAKEKMADFGASFIQNGGVYLTHCHSSTVVAMFKRAKLKGKRFSVIATETRPKFQGRVTAKELLEAGIDDVTLIIDDVAESIIQGRLKHVDSIFIGADLLSNKGLVNKVGSLGIAYAAKANNIPFYSLSVLLKYDPRPFSYDIIEQRSKDEIWGNAPKGLVFYAPAFDFVPYDTGIGIICEKGLVKNQKLSKMTYDVYPFLKEE